MNKAQTRYLTPLLALFVLLAILALPGCASPQENAKSIMQTLEIGDDESGCAEIRATVDLSGNPFVTSNASLIIKKAKGENPPQC